MKHFVATAAFFIFLLFQIVCTSTNRTLYPFSPYRMFSKNWKGGIEMDHVVVKENNQAYRTWDLLDIPFFQANQIFYSTYLDPSPERQRQAVCSLIKEQIPGKSEIQIFGQVIRFSDENGTMSGQLLSSGLRWTCR